MADMHSIAEKMRLSVSTVKIWMKTYPHYRRQKKCRPMTLVSGGIRFIRIFAGVPWTWYVESNDSEVVDNGNFQNFRWLFFQNVYRWGQHYYIAIRSPSSAFQWSQNAWRWMTLTGYFALNSVFAAVWLTPSVQHLKNNCVKTNKDRHILSAAKVLDRDSSFWQYKDCADIRSSSLERRR